jgi:SMODS and SLOG-associating 2TM effector domain 1/SMODS and SLOG-associating 2TM effector domain 3
MTMQTSTLARELGIAAATAQHAFFRLHRVQLILIVAAALVGAFTIVLPEGAVNLAGLIAALFFGTGLLMRIVIMNRHDEEEWFTARRDAERAKSLCFRYAFGASGFERSRDAAEAEQRLANASASLGSAVVLEPASDADVYSVVSADMNKVRALEFGEARERYRVDRIAGQERWYGARATENRRNSRWWLLVMLIAEVGGLAFGILTAVDLAPPGLVGLMSAIAAAAVAWTQLRQHSLLATLYASHAAQLRDFGRRASHISPTEWPEFVEAVETSLESEQTRWQGLLGQGR